MNKDGIEQQPSCTAIAKPNQDRVVVAPFVRVERERDGEGWIVITATGNGWILGSRSDALREKRWHDRQWGRA
jgi:hypothetical protein